MDRNRKHENTDWYATADSKESVKVDNDGNGLLRLWQQQICQFPNVGFDVAQSIVAEYNSPQALIEVRKLITFMYIQFMFVCIINIFIFINRHMTNVRIAKKLNYCFKIYRLVKLTLYPYFFKI